MDLTAYYVFLKVVDCTNGNQMYASLICAE
jgi:hypothetical protein